MIKLLNKKNLASLAIRYATAVISLGGQLTLAADYPLHNLEKTPPGVYESFCAQGYEHCGGGVMPDWKLLPEIECKNQDPLGTCSVFAAAGCYESLKHCNNIKSLSANH